MRIQINKRCTGHGSGAGSALLPPDREASVRTDQAGIGATRCFPVEKTGGGNEYPNLVLQVADLRREAVQVFERVVWPDHETAGYAQTLYGYMHRVFGFVDILSSYWRGNDKDQSPRMVDFMVKYFGPNRRAHSVAVQIWRHKLAHTALPRNLLDATTGRTMYYMIQWHARQMHPQQPHYSIVSFGRDEVFNLACISLLEDLEAATVDFLGDLEASPAIQANAARFTKELESYKLRTL